MRGEQEGAWGRAQTLQLFCFLRHRLLLVGTFSTVNLSIAKSFGGTIFVRGINPATLSMGSSNSNLQVHSSRRHARNALVRFDSASLHT